MSGIDYLLDTNFILGLLKSNPETSAWIDERQIRVSQCAYSAITRMELLGYPGITPSEVQLIEAKLALLTYLPLTMKVEDIAIRLRRTHRVKLPDAIIAASALAVGAELLTFDVQLRRLMAQERATRSASDKEP